MQRTLSDLKAWVRLSRDLTEDQLFPFYARRQWIRAWLRTSSSTRPPKDLIRQVREGGNPTPSGSLPVPAPRWTVPRVDKGREDYLQILAECGLKGVSAEAAGISVAGLHQYRRSNPEFEEAEKHAIQLFKERKIEKEAIRRAVEGTEKGIYYNGVLVATERQYSDRLLELLLKKHDPSYREKLHADVDIKGGVMVVSPPPESTKEWLDRHQQKPEPKDISHEEKENE